MSARNDGNRERETFVHALEVLRRRWLVVAAAVLACMAAAVLQYVLSDDSYEASARVMFGAPTLSDAALQVDRGGTDPEREAATNVLIAESSQVAGAVRSRLGTDASAGSLLDAVSVEAEENADVLLITASSPTPAEAARIANAFADEYIAFKAFSDVQNIQRAERDLQRQLDALPSDARERDSLQESLQRLASLRAVATGDGRVITRAAAPLEPAGLGLLPLLVLAGILGLAVGLAVVFLLESLDTRLNHMDEFEHEYRLPALAGIPDAAVRQGALGGEEHLEPFRILRSAIDFTRVSREVDVVMVTSAVPGEGKTTVAVNLARAIALTGRRVVLVELDLRRPTIGQQLDIDPRRGVTTALMHQAPLADLLQTPVPGRPNLAVLPAGRLPPNPSELLGSPAMEELLNELAADDTIVIVDAPPLLPVADAQVLLNQAAVDSSLIVARAGVTTRDEVRRTRAILDRHVRPPLGLVVTGLDAAEAYGYEAYVSQDPSVDASSAPPSPSLDDVRS